MTTYIYFIQESDNGAIKIGRANNVKRRMATMQSGNSRVLILLGSLQGENCDEVRIHKALADHCIRGEWFCPTEYVLLVKDRVLNEGVEWLPPYVPISVSRRPEPLKRLPHGEYDITYAAVLEYVREKRPRQALASASGLHLNTLPRALAKDWQPTMRTLTKLAEGLRALPPTIHPNPCNIPV